jgi:hypothetical protein
MFMGGGSPMRFSFLPLILAGVLSAQELPPVPSTSTAVTQHNVSMTHSDLYCAGYLGKPRPRGQRSHYVAAGSETPHQARYSAGEYIYLRGTDYEPGTRVSIVRELHDVNRLSPFSGRDKLSKHAGQAYADVGYAVVQQAKGKDVTVAKVEFACESIVPGDQVVPFTARQILSYRKTSTLDRFPSEAPSLAGKIVGARNLEQFVGAGSAVYLNVGSDHGLKPGDYLRIVRGYDRKDFDLADAASYDQTIKEDSQKNPPQMPKKELKNLPRHVIGELMVLSTQDTTATAFVGSVLEEVHLGDTVELETEAR